MYICTKLYIYVIILEKRMEKYLIMNIQKYIQNLKIKLVMK